MKPRWLHKLSLQWLFIAMLWLLVAYMFFMPDRYYYDQMQLSPNHPTEDSLAFVPPHVSLTALPGVIRGTVTLRNASRKPLSHITLTTSCFCTKILGPTTIPNLPYQKSITIRYQITCPESGDLAEGLYASLKGDTLREPIDIHVLSPIFEAQPQWQLPTLIRRAPGSPTVPTLVTFHPYPSIYELHLSSRIPWLRLSQKLLPHKGFVLVCQASPEAPEGSFVGFVHAEYLTPNQTGAADIPITGLIRSKWHVSPPQYTFGLVAQNSPPPAQTFQIVTDETLPPNLSVHCTNPSLQADLGQHTSHQASLSVRLLTNHPGEIDAYVQLKGGGKLLLVIPIAAFVQKSFVRVTSRTQTNDGGREK